MIDITALGELLIDFTPCGKNERGVQLFAENPGGAPANVLAMASRLGGKTAFLGKVGRDAFGDFLRGVLVQNGIDSSGLAVDGAAPTTLAFVQLDENGDRSFTFYRDPGADRMLTTGEIKPELIGDCRIFHFGSVSMTHEPSRSATFYAAQYAKEQGKLVSFDPNYRAMLWDSEEKALEQIKKGIAIADILKVSEEEAQLITGDKDPAGASQKLLGMGPALVLVSLGELGAYYRNHACSGYVPTYQVDTVDTTGAGDAFVGAFLWKVRSMMKEELKFMPTVELRQIVSFANAAGALTTTGSGAIPAMPNMEQIRQCQGKEV